MAQILDERVLGVGVDLLVRCTRAQTEAYRLPWKGGDASPTYNARVNGWRLPLIRGPVASDADIEASG